MSKAKWIIAMSLTALSLGAQAGEVEYWWHGANGEAGEPFVIPPSVLTREQVRAELAAAIARGELAFGEAGAPFVGGPSVLSRAQVRAELMEAIRLGVHGSHEAGAPIATPEQEARIAAAGRLAAERYAQRQR